MTPADEIARVAAGLTKAQRDVALAAKGLAETDTPYLSFKHLSELTGHAWSTVREACRALREAGVMEYATGLQTDDGEMYGSGYCLTPLGLSIRAFLEQEPQNEQP